MGIIFPLTYQEYKDRDRDHKASAKEKNDSKWA